MKDEFAQAMNDQRNFLHDLSNQLLIAQGMAAAAKKMLDGNDSIDEKVIVRIEKSINASDKMIELLRSQREKVLECQERLQLT